MDPLSVPPRWIAASIARPSCSPAFAGASTPFGGFGVVKNQIKNTTRPMAADADAAINTREEGAGGLTNFRHTGQSAGRLNLRANFHFGRTRRTPHLPHFSHLRHLPHLTTPANPLAQPYKR